MTDTFPTFPFPSLSPDQTAEIIQLIGELDEFKGHWRRVTEVRAEKLASLRYDATIESTASSIRIEGAQLSDADVAKVLEGVSSDSFRTRDEEEAKGYHELHETIFESYAAIPLEENFIRQLHGILLKYSQKDERHRGEYKKVANDVAKKYPDGKTEILLRSATPFDTPRLMAQLVGVANETFEQGALHKLIIIARFVVEFLEIHPFEDGNGRLSRALTTLLLLRSDYLYVPYSSLERVIENTNAEYYTALHPSQAGASGAGADYGTWLLYFLRSLRTQKRSLETKLAIERGVRELSDLQRQVLDLVTTSGRATSTQVGDHLKLPYRTVRYHLDALIARGLVAAHGAKRGSYYTRAVAPADPFAHASIEGGTNDVIADIYLGGGRIGARDLRTLLKSHGFDPRTAGILHGRRVAQLRKDTRNGQSVLTSRGEEIARQVVLSRRIREGLTGSTE